jgi:hypothetical protein
MSGDGPRRWSSASFLPMSNRCLVQLGTSQESGHQQSCSKHAKRRCVQIPIQCPPLYFQYSFISQSFSRPLPAAASLLFKRRINIFSTTSASSLRWPGWSNMKNEYHWCCLDDMILKAIVGLACAAQKRKTSAQLPLFQVRGVACIRFRTSDPKAGPRDQNTHLDSWELSPHSKERQLQEVSGLVGAG